MSGLGFADDSAKVVLLGGSGVGKSSLALRFTRNEFRPYCESTIGASFSTKVVEVLVASKTPEDGDQGTEVEASQQTGEMIPRKIEFKIWDTAGQEKYASLAPMYYRGAAAAILVYDISNRHSFLVLKDWAEEIRNKGPQDIIVVVCGNKSDLAEERQVPMEEAKAYAVETGASYMETSARDDCNVEDMFLELGKRIPFIDNNGAIPRGVDLQQAERFRPICC